MAVVVSYPPALRAAPGNMLSSIELDDLAEKYGSRLLVAGRFFNQIIFKIAPTIIIASYGACRLCLVLINSADLLTYGTFCDDVKSLIGERKYIIVCAPPLDGAHAFGLADLAWKEAYPLETTLAELQTLDGVSCCLPKRVEIATIELFTRLDREAHNWWAAAGTATKPNLQLDDYAARCASTEFPNYLAQWISRFTTPTISYRSLPDVNIPLIDGLTQIATHCLKFRGGYLLAVRAYKVMMSHPETILDRIYNEEVMTVSRKISSRTELGKKLFFRLPTAYKLLCNIVRYHNIPDVLHSPETAFKNLDEFLGGYLVDLNLSQSYITGSAAMSSVLYHPRHALFNTHTDFLESYFPSIFSKVTPSDAQALLDMSRIVTWREGTPPPFTFADVAAPQNVSALSDDGSLRTFKAMRWFAGLPGEGVIPFEVTPGVGVDIVIDATDCEFDLIARSHYEVIKRRFPSATLVSAVDNEGSHVHRVVSSKAPGLEKGFRVVEMYRSSWAEICKSSVGMTRLAYTAARLDGIESRQAEFYMTASCMKSAVDYGTPNYYHRESQKISPQEVLLKYAMRGYPPKFLPTTLQRAIQQYAWQTSRWNPSGDNPHWDDYKKLSPARRGVGDFNLANYTVEASAFNHDDSDSDSDNESALVRFNHDDSDSDSDNEPALVRFNHDDSNS